MARLALATAVALVAAASATAAGPTAPPLLFTGVGAPSPGGDAPFAVYSVGADSRLTQLTAACVDCGANPAASPDGTRIAYDELQDEGTAAVVVMRRDGTGKRIVARGCAEPRWSPDGKKLVCELQDERGGIGVVGAGGGRLSRVARIPDGVYPDWSPDGKRFAFEVHREPWAAGTYVASIDGSHLRLVAADALEPRWSPDGKRLVVVRADLTGLEVVRPDGGPTLSIAKRGVTSASWSPDGRRLAFTSAAIHILDLRTRSDRALVLDPDLCRYGCTTVDWARG